MKERSRTFAKGPTAVVATMTTSTGIVNRAQLDDLFARACQTQNVDNFRKK